MFNQEFSTRLDLREVERGLESRLSGLESRLRDLEEKVQRRQSDAEMNSLWRSITVIAIAAGLFSFYVIGPWLRSLIFG